MSKLSCSPLAARNARVSGSRRVLSLAILILMMSESPKRKTADASPASWIWRACPSGASGPASGRETGAAERVYYEPSLEFSHRQLQSSLRGPWL